MRIFAIPDVTSALTDRITKLAFTTEKPCFALSVAFSVSNSVPMRMFMQKFCFVLVDDNWGYGQWNWSKMGPRWGGWLCEQWVSWLLATSSTTLICKLHALFGFEHLKAVYHILFCVQLSSACVESFVIFLRKWEKRISFYTEKKIN